LQLLRSKLEEKELVTDRATIAAAYAKSWLLLDCLSSIPFTLLDLISDKTTYSARSLQILRVVKALKIIRLVYSFQFLQTVLKPSTVRLSGYVLVSCYVVHLTGCGYWAVAVQGNDDDVDIWYKAQDQLSTATFSAKYIAALYWAVVSLLGGEQYPSSTMQRLYGFLVAVLRDIVCTSRSCIVTICFWLQLLGVVVTSCIVGGAVSVVQSLTAVAQEKRAQTDAINHFLEVNKITGKLAGLVKQYQEYEFNSKVRVQRQPWLQNMPGR
jgi:hypothetical protein